MKCCSFKGGTVCDHKLLPYLIFSEMRELNVMQDLVVDNLS